MTETTEQYVGRISSYVAGKNHLKVLGSTTVRIGKLLKGVSASRLTRTPQPGKWTVSEILAHLAESELVFGYRLRLVLASRGTQIQAFDQDDWQKNAGYLKRDPKLGFELFRVLREANVALLKSLSKDQWSIFGIHQERGQENVLRMVELYAGHDVNHLKQIQKILNGARSKKAR